MKATKLSSLALGFMFLTNVAMAQKADSPVAPDSAKTELKTKTPESVLVQKYPFMKTYENDAKKRGMAFLDNDILRSSNDPDLILKQSRKFMSSGKSLQAAEAFRLAEYENDKKGVDTVIEYDQVDYVYDDLYIKGLAELDEQGQTTGTMIISVTDGKGAALLNQGGNLQFKLDGNESVARFQEALAANPDAVAANLRKGIKSEGKHYPLGVTTFERYDGHHPAHKSEAKADLILLGYVNQTASNEKQAPAMKVTQTRQ